MAKKVIVTLIDDFDNESVADQTVHFSFDGIDYEVDVSTKNADTLREYFRPWVDKARRVGRTGRKAAKPRTQDKKDTTAIREWARQQGHSVSARGRIPAEIVDAYREATS